MSAPWLKASHEALKIKRKTGFGVKTPEKFHQTSKGEKWCGFIFDRYSSSIFTYCAFVHKASWRFAPNYYMLIFTLR